MSNVTALRTSPVITVADVMDGPYQFMPPLSAQEQETLEASILANGVQNSILVDENGSIIDGYNRHHIAMKLGIDCPREVRAGLTETQKRSLAMELNTARRSLSPKQKRALILASLQVDPQLSNLEHARRCGASDKTVESVRQTNSEIPNSGDRVTASGNKAGGPKPTPLASYAEHREHVTEVIVANPALSAMAIVTKLETEGIKCSDNTVAKLRRSIALAQTPVEQRGRSDSKRQFRALEEIDRSLCSNAAVLEELFLDGRFELAVTREVAAKYASSMKGAMKRINNMVKTIEERGERP